MPRTDWDKVEIAIKGLEESKIAEKKLEKRVEVIEDKCSALRRITILIAIVLLCMTATMALLIN